MRETRQFLGAAAYRSASAGLPTQARGAEQLVHVLEDIRRVALASIRAAVDIPLDTYVEAPDDLGGFMRYYEIAELVAGCAPVYLKFGLRNSPNIYPSGGRLQDLATAMAVERVRRAELGLELLARYLPGAVASEPGAADQALISPSVR